MNFLITGARAPIALEWATRLRHEGAKVVLADSCLYPLGRLLRPAVTYESVPPPRDQLRAYKKKILEIVTRENIQWIIPTCEEIFYLASFQNELPATCRLFADQWEKLARFHHKSQLIHEAEGCPIALPKTVLLQDKAALLTWSHEQGAALENSILKPAYSRFGSKTLLHLTPKILERVDTFPLVAQQKIPGKEFCSYSIFQQGKLLAHSCYHPKYRAGLGAGVYLEPADPSPVRDFVEAFAQKHSFTGQLAFDFMQNPQGEFYLLECNPRGTSGIHLLAHENKFIRIFTDPNLTPCNFENKPVKVNFGMWIYALSHVREHGLKNFFHDLKNAQDVYDCVGQGHLAWWQLLSFAEILARCVIKRVGMKEATTADIEWNGQRLDP